MNKQTKTVALLIIIVVISYNIYDFIKAKNDRNESDVRKCMTQFIQNTSVSEPIARSYCDCALEKLRSKYEHSELPGDQIRENEKELLQGCYDQAIISKKK